jgi:hypothetical protein
MIVITSTLIEGGGGCSPTSHLSAGVQETESTKRAR